jgi:hypothetical protein
MRVVRNWLVVVVLMSGVPATAANPRNIDLGTGIDEVVTLEQNWIDAESNWFYDVPQGSRLVPYDWFLHLEQPTEQKPFRDADHVRSLGYIPRTKDNGDNQDGLPIGFIRDAKLSDGSDALGLTCAACHTSLIVQGRKGYLIDGGPGMGDLEELLKRLAKSLEATAADDTKFDRFAAKVLPAGSPAAEKARLRDRVREHAQQRTAYNDRNLSKNAQGRFGHGRVDAFGAIFNEVAATFLDMPGNVHAANAPVSYPCLWDTPQHDVVQWNGAAENKTNLLGKLLFGTEHVGALGRNAGEVLGVFGFADIPSNEPLLIPRPYPSTIHKANLIKIEDSLTTLWSPEWPFGPPDAAAVDRGKILFAQNCAKCHVSIDRKDPARTVEAQLADVGTDQQMIANFTRTGSTGRLRGRQETLLDLTKRLGPTEPIPLILKHVVERVILNQTLPSTDLVKEIAKEKLKPGAKVSLNALNPGYRMIATIKVGDKKLTGEFDSIVKEGNMLKVRGGHFYLLDANHDVSTGVAAGDAIDLATTAGLERAAGRLPGLLTADVADGEPAADIQGSVQFNYKARPLNGIWATAPYLHNGSVRTLAELLKPASERAKKFHVGSRTFDPVGVGFMDDPTMPELDTAGTGNGNGGHEFGASLNDTEKKDLLEYLKSL